MGGSNSKAEICRILGLYGEGVVKKGKRSQRHCLSWGADVLEAWLLGLLGAMAANTSEVLGNSSCLVSLPLGHG